MNMLDWRLLLSSAFWFRLSWNPLQPGTAVLMAVFFVAFIAVGVLLWILPRKRLKADPPLRRALARGGNVCVATGLLGLLFTFTTYEQAGLFAARFWFLAIALLFLGWGGWTAWRAHILVPAERDAASIRERLDRYFPKRKK